MVDNVELAVYRTLASFGFKSSSSYSNSEMEAFNLHEIVKKFVNFYKSQGLRLPDELLNLIPFTINGTLYKDQQSMRPQITDYALQIIYDTIKLLHEKNLWNGINSTLFNQKNTRIFIFPGQP